MEDLVRSYWWLVFPLMWFVFGTFGMALAARRERAALELMKTYAAQGKDPSDLARALNPGPDYWDRRWARRAWRYTPYWAWPRAIMAGCVAVGFWIAAYYADWPWDWPGLWVVAVIMSFVAVGALLRAIMLSVFAPRAPQL